MPSPNPRIQVCCEPELHAKVKTLAKGRNRTMSNVVQELVELAFTLDEIKKEYQEACQTYGEVPVQKDMRQRPKARPHSKFTEEDRRRAMDVLEIKVKSDEAAEAEKWEAEKEMDFEIPGPMKKLLMQKLMEKLLAE